MNDDKGMTTSDLALSVEARIMAAESAGPGGTVVLTQSEAKTFAAMLREGARVRSTVDLGLSLKRAVDATPAEIAEWRAVWQRTSRNSRPELVAGPVCMVDGCPHGLS